MKFQTKEWKLNQRLTQPCTECGSGTGRELLRGQTSCSTGSDWSANPHWLLVRCAHVAYS